MSSRRLQSCLRIRSCRGLLSVWLGLAAAGLSAAPVRNGAVTAELVSATGSIQPGRPFRVALHLEHDLHWHSYWSFAGTGYPTRLTWDLPAGWTTSEIEWPVPGLIRDRENKIVGQGYEGAVDLLVTITPPASLPAGQKTTLRAKAEWLMCAESCVPGEAELTLVLPVTAVPDPQGVDKLFAATGRLPIPPPPTWALAAGRAGRAVVLTVQAPTALPAPHFFTADGYIAYDQEQSIKTEGATLQLTLPLASDGDPATRRLTGVLTFTMASGETAGLTIDLALLPVDKVPILVATSPMSTAAPPGFLVTLGLAFLGGLVLNLMPCVFPVLGIKVLGFIHQSGQDRRKVAGHGLTFSAGVLLSFWIIAAGFIGMRSGGAQLGWGFQLQSPAFVFTLAVVMLVFALALSGVFEFGLAATGWGARLQSRQGLAGSFFSGVLATVVATPCSAPFLAPALGATLVLAPAGSFAVFTAIALGLAAPYLLLSVFPAAVKILPRPGVWMESFKQCMAFPLYATTGYLLWVLAGQTAENGLLMAFFGVTLIAMAAWCYGRFAAPGEGFSRGLGGFLAALVLLAAGLFTGWPKAAGADEILWQPWSPEAVAQASASGKTVYVDFTARWCATCQANKKLVFTNAEILRAFRNLGVVAFKADWTNRDARITAELEKWHRSAVPFNLVLRPGHEPQPLPELLTPGAVLGALQSP